MEWTELSLQPPEKSEELILVWHVFLQCYTDRAENCDRNRFYSHWMPAPKDGWTRVEDRQPTQKDADLMNCILVANDDLSVMQVTGWFQTEVHPEYTQWMPTPKGPPHYKELMKKLY